MNAVHVQTESQLSANSIKQRGRRKKIQKREKDRRPKGDLTIVCIFLIYGSRLGSREIVRDPLIMGESKVTQIGLTYTIKTCSRAKKWN